MWQINDNDDDLGTKQQQWGTEVFLLPLEPIFNTIALGHWESPRIITRRIWIRIRLIFLPSVASSIPIRGRVAILVWIIRAKGFVALVVFTHCRPIMLVEYPAYLSDVRNIRMMFRRHEKHNESVHHLQTIHWHDTKVQENTKKDRDGNQMKSRSKQDG